MRSGESAEDIAVRFVTRVYRVCFAVRRAVFVGRGRRRPGETC
jgi:hypothetical protein